MWQDEHTLAFEDFIDSYRQDYLAEKMIRKQKQQAVSESVVELENYRLNPNKMQVAFVKNVRNASNNRLGGTQISDFYRRTAYESAI